MAAPTPPNADDINTYTQAISAHISNLLSEIARVSAVKTAPPPPPPPPPTPPPASTHTTNNNFHINNNSNFDELLRHLQNITSELAGLRRDVDQIKAQLGNKEGRSNSGNDDSLHEQTTTDKKNHEEQLERKSQHKEAVPTNKTNAEEYLQPSSPHKQATCTEEKINLEELMELHYTQEDHFMPEEHYLLLEGAEDYNKLAIQYNSGLRKYHDQLAPLHNKQNKLVFGFPATLGDLLYLDPVAESLLCEAFGVRYMVDGFRFSDLCGVNRSHDSYPPEYMAGSDIVSLRILIRDKRARDIATAGDPTRETRRAATGHNIKARRHNAGAYDGEIMPIHDERNLPLPGFPRDYEGFSKYSQSDVLYFLREYGLDVEPEGCFQRFKAFVGVPLNPWEPEKGVEWHL